LLFFAPHPFAQLRLNAGALGRVALLQTDGLPWSAVPGFGTVYPFSLPFAVLGIWECFKRRRESGAALVLCWLATAVCTGLFFMNVNINRLNLIHYPVIVLSAMGLTAVVRKVKTPAVAAFTVMYAVVFMLFVQTYFGAHNEWVSRLFYAGFNESAAFARETGYDRLYVTTQLQHRGWWWSSEILTLFAMRIDPSLLQDRAAYNERYRYSDFRTRLTNEPPPGERWLYIVHRDDAWVLTNHSVEWFGDYGVAQWNP
jgi:hypothetical protein